MVAAVFNLMVDLEKLMVLLVTWKVELTKTIQCELGAVHRMSHKPSEINMERPDMPPSAHGALIAYRGGAEHYLMDKRIAKMMPFQCLAGTMVL